LEPVPLHPALDQFVATGIVQIEGTHAVSHERLEMSWTQGGVKFRMVIRDGRHARPHDRVERQRRPCLHSRWQVHRKQSWHAVVLQRQ
jgi:hypothetical protein